jgi:Tfp pilus assembly protein PilV
MISLKKNDKIILIVAVVILVIAGVGVAMYQSPSTQENMPSESVKEKSYEVTWMTRNGSLMTINDFANKKAKYQGAIQISETDIKSVTFNLSWVDDRMTLLKRMGLDSLTLEVTDPNGMMKTATNISARITGEGTLSLTFYSDFSPPQGPIDASTEEEAQSMLMEDPYYDDSWTNKDFSINVSVHIGELRIIKKLLDKGNDFELKITYQYYDAVINEDTTKNTGGDNIAPPDDDYWSDESIQNETEEPPYISMIINTGCGRFV